MPMTSYRDLPIRKKLMLAMVSTSATAVFLAAIVFIAFQWVNTKNAVLDTVDAAMAIISSNSTAALIFNDPEAARQTLSALRAKQEIQLACIYTEKNGSQPGAFAAYSNSAVQRSCPVAPGVDAFSILDSKLSRSMPIEIEDDQVGKLYIERSLQDFVKTMWGYVLMVVLSVFTSLLMAFSLSGLLQRAIARPILSLSSIADRVSQSGDYGVRVPPGNRDEIGQLIKNFNEMLAQIGLRDKALEQAKTELETRVEETNQANRELQETLEKLRLTQEQLVQTEKMASLGGLVAGIAHEINTPIGVSVTAASTLQAKTQTMSEEYASNTLTDSGLKRYVDLATQSTDILLTNLDRAAELIHSFKQVAVDQSSRECRSFAVKEYINEVLLSLRPKLKKTALKVDIECDEALRIKSYPGALAQIMTNLIMNSLIHAYDPGQSGTLTISVKQESDTLHLRYSDDGKGMPPEHVEKVFDPFFTTKRGMGGSGLGMHILFNLVRQQLNGNVTLKSELGVGTTVDILIPIPKET